MHRLHLAELAALLASQTPRMVAQRAELSELGVTAYWAATRSRMDLWDQALSRYQKTIRGGDAAAIRYWWVRHDCVLEDIMVGELLARVMAGLASKLEFARRFGTASSPRVAGDGDPANLADLADPADATPWSPVTDRVLSNHLDAGNRVAEILIRGRGGSTRELVSLGRLRSAVDQWADSLIASMVDGSDPEIRYGCDAKRTCQLARENSDGAIGDSARRLRGELSRAAMIETLRQRVGGGKGLQRANAAVGRAALQVMQSEWCGGGLAVSPQPG